MQYCNLVSIGGNLLQEVVQDHDRGLIGKYTMANGVKENQIHPRILTLKTPVKLDSTKQA